MRLAAIVVSLGLATTAAAQEAPKGEIKGSAWVHTADSLAASAQDANVVLPASATGGAVFTGKLRDAPKKAAAKVPVILFMHGSSGLGLAAISEWQKFMASLGYASVAPNSFSLADRATYKSPIAKADYEKMHALRLSEIAPALAAIKAAPWADSERLVLAGTSEGSVPVARYAGKEFAARILYAWSCEPNYFVEDPRNALEPEKPVLNVISSTDPFFSRSNGWLGNAESKGHCGQALKDNKQAAIVLIPDAPHTLLMLPAARAATVGFLAEALKK